MPIGPNSWTLSKLISDMMGVWLASEFDRWEKGKQDQRETPWIDPDWRQTEHLSRFSGLIDHFIPGDELTFGSFDPFGEHHEIFQAMSDSENAYKIIKDCIDFDVMISKRIQRFRGERSLRAGFSRLLSPQDRLHWTNIVNDSKLYKFDFDHENIDLITTLLSADREIEKFGKPSLDLILRLKEYFNNKPRGRPKKFAFKYITVAAAEIFESYNRLSLRSVINESKDLNSEKACYSPFLDFFQDFLATIGAGRTFGDFYETASYARQILKAWRRNREAFNGALIRGGAVADLRELLGAIEALSINSK